jgi:hypothetical protein
MEAEEERRRERIREDERREEARRERIREDERRWDQTQERNRLEETAEHKQLMDHEELEKFLKGVETGDYGDWHRHTGLLPEEHGRRLPDEYGQGTEPSFGTLASFYELFVHPHVLAVRSALNAADRVPWISRDQWLFELELIQPDELKNGLHTVQMTIGSVTQIRDLVRPGHQGMSFSAWRAFDAQLQLILDKLKVLEAQLAKAAS